MIVADTSALMAIVAREPYGENCAKVLGSADLVAVSAATLVELAMVAHGRGLAETVARFARTFDFEIMPVTEETSNVAIAAFHRWGKGIHPARLNFGDCFSYALAKQLDCPLLFVGNDFSQTDIEPAVRHSG